MDSNLIEAFWHSDHKVYGRRLKPLTLRHAFVLASADNPLVTGSRAVTREDTLQAVEICSREATFFLRGKSPSWLARQITTFFAITDPKGPEKFAAYLSDYCTSPKVWKSEGGSAVKSHFTVATVAGLCQWLGIDVDRAWEMTLGEANFLIAAAIEQSPHASIDLVSEREIALSEMLDREEAA